MIWFVLAFLTGASVLAVLWPLSRAATRPLSAGDADFYRHQLAEIDAEGRRGTLPGEALEAARAEAARRLIAAAAAEGPAAPPDSGSRRTAALGAVVLIPLVTLALYTRTGSPALPDQPLSARLQAPAEGLDMDQALARIEKHLMESPADGQGFEVVAPVYLRLGRAEDAARAYANAIRLLGPTAPRLSSYGEALMMAAGGVVTAEAKAQFTAASAADPKEAKARFFLGLAAEQEGDAPRAKEIWTKLLDEAPPGAPYLPILRQRLGAPAPVAQGPDSEAGAVIAGLPPADQQAAVRGMVARLAERLASRGGGLPEWQRLVRAYAVLNEGERARSALGEARRTFSGDSEALRALDTLGRDLGLGG